MFHIFAVEPAGGNDLVGWVIYLAIGGVCGWLASVLMKTDAQMGLIANVIVGIVGAMVAAWLFPRLGLKLGGGMVGGIVSAVLGAAILLAVLKLLGIFK